jgi:hypothetical protein
VLPKKVVAKADLDILPERMAATVERAMADDPKELRRRLGALQDELQKAQATTTPVEVPVVSDDHLQALRTISSSLAQVVQSLQASLARVRPDLSPSSDLATTAAPRRPAERHAQERPANGHDAAPQLRAGERRLLETVVRHHPAQLTRAQLATIAGFTASGGTFGAYIGTLKRAGLLAEHPHGLEATGEGLQQVGEPPRDPRPPKKSSRSGGALSEPANAACSMP